jgi:hypothetical protein
MNNLPPLPLTDGWLFIDNSTLDILTTCPRAFEYFFFHNKIASGERSALNFGSGMHLALENFYRTGLEKDSEISPYQSGLNVLTEHFSLHPQGEDEYRSLDLATKMFDFYTSKYLSEDFEICVLANGKPCIETTFSLPLCDDYGLPQRFFYQDTKKETHSFCVIYTGKIDLIVKKNLQIFTLDHKTAFQFGQTFWQEQQMSAQHVGYCDSADKILGLTTSGYIVNGMRTRKLGGKTHPLPYDEDFERNIYYLTPERKKEWRNNLIHLIHELCDNVSRDYLPMKTKWCVGKYGPCPYFDICSLPNPIERKLVLESGLYRDNDWSPLKQVKQETLKP